MQLLILSMLFLENNEFYNKQAGLRAGLFLYTAHLLDSSHGLSHDFSCLHRCAAEGEMYVDICH